MFRNDDAQHKRLLGLLSEWMEIDAYGFNNCQMSHRVIDAHGNAMVIEMEYFQNFNDGRLRIRVSPKNKLLSEKMLVIREPYLSKGLEVTIGPYHTINEELLRHPIY